MKAVIDANVVISSFINPLGPPARILEAFYLNHAFDWVTSPQIWDEYRIVMGRPRLKPYLPSGFDSSLWAARVAPLTVVVPNSSLPGSVPADPSDEKYLAAAVEGLADVVVSGDADLLNLGRYEEVRILNPSTFLKELVT